MIRQLPTELTNGEPQAIALQKSEVKALEQTKSAVLGDLRFEHLRNVDDQVWHFVAESWIDRETDHVPAFVELHGRELEELTCYMTVEHLSVEHPTDVLGIRLLPVDDPSLPATGAWFNVEKPVGCVAAVVVTGTNSSLMADRARVVSSHVLRVLRVALREHMGIADMQLRFRMGTSYAFDTRISGMRQREDAAGDLEFGGELVEMAENQPVSSMPVLPVSDIDRKADLALRWMERARLTGEPLVALLYLFFALEALLGDKSERLKAHGLAFRQTMLSHIVKGRMTHPNETWFLYDRVRSGAVHGEDAPDVSWDKVESFEIVVRWALSQYLTLAHEQRITKRGRLLKLLDEHPDRPMIVAWLRTNGGDIWTDYLDRLEASA